MPVVPLRSTTGYVPSCLRHEWHKRLKNGSIGEKVAEFDPVVKIQNNSFNDFKGNRVCFMMMGEDTTKRGSLKVICRREFDADLISSKTFERVGETFTQGFDRTLVKGGFDYDGNIVIMKSSEGKPAVTAESKSAWTKNVEKAFALEEGKEYDKAHFK